MMSTEFAEIIPDRYPHATNFINESCHNSYNNAAAFYSSDSGSCTHSFDTRTTHHSLILEYPNPGPGQNQVLDDNKDRASSGRTSYSCEQNIRVGSGCIQLLVKEANSIFPGAVDFSGTHINGDHMAGNEDKAMDDSMGGVQVRIQCADEERDTELKIQRLSHDLLQPTSCPATGSPPSSCGSVESIGSPTPTPSYGGLTSSTTLEYPGCEDKPCGVRGSEVAGLDCTLDSVCVPGPLCEQSSEDRERRLLDDLQIKSGHIKSTCDLLPPMPTRRSHLSNLRSPNIHLLIPTSETRKLSDPAIHVRRQRLKTNFEPRRHRCLSDSEAPSFPYTLADDDELKSEECYSALGCDSGFHDERMSRYQENVNQYSSPRVSLYSSDLYSQEDGSEPTLAQPRMRRTTPNPYVSPFSQDSSHSDDQSVTHSNPGTMVHPRERTRRSMMKHFSQGSIGGLSIGGGSVGGTSSLGASSESPSVSSVLETQSNLTCATDILSSLGFDDFDSPQLVPDRFIPKELEHLKPTSMKAAFIEQILSPDPPRSPDSLTSGHSSTQAVFVPQRPVDISDLPLGATAENFLPVRSGSPVNNTSSAIHSEDSKAPMLPATPADSTPLFTDTAAMAGFSRSRVLETVPEETASDLSPSPRWLSPRVSIDHSVLDLAEGKLGASLVQKVRRRSLPTREGYRWSIGSLVESDTGGDSIHLSVTSYDDELAAERERERENLLPPGVHDDITIGAGRRRRRGVYTPPQTLLSWLSTQKTIDEEADTDPDELPWPFNEQAHLRKSLTEISLAQQRSLSDNAVQLSAVACGDSDDGNLPQESSVPDLSISPASSPNIRLSPHPTLSDIDEDLEPNNLDVEATNPSHYHQDEVTHSDSNPLGSQQSKPGQVNLSGDGGIPEDVDPDKALLYPHDNHQPHQYHHLIPISTSPRRRKQVVSPFTVRRPILPSFFNERMPSNVDVKLPSPPADEDKLPLPLINTVNENVLATHSASDLLEPVDSAEDLSTVPPTDGVVTVSSSDDSNKESIGGSSATASSVSIDSEPSVRPSRRPRLSTLRQSSSDSLSDGLLENMSEIELLTGDIHSPVLSSRRSRVPLKRQKSMEESSQPASPATVGAVSTSQPRPTRRVAIIGEAPNSSDLFASTTITENKSGVGKYMVL